MSLSRLGLNSLSVALLVLGTSLTAAAAGSGGVRFSLSCGTLHTGSGTFMVSADGSGSAVTVPCGGSATATNPSWTAGSAAIITLVSQPMGTMLALPFTTRVSLTAGVVEVSMSAVPIPTGGVNIRLSCASGLAGSAVFKVTANGSSSLVTVACGQSATVSNPLWTAATIASVDPVTVPKGTYLNLIRPRVPLTTSVAAYAASLEPCPTGRVSIPACPAPPRSALEQLLSGSPLRMVVFLVLLSLISMLIVIVPFEFWIIRGWIRYFSRKQNPRDVIADLSARPGLGWWVRRYVGYVRLKHRLFKTSLPPGFDDGTSSDRAA